jgi:hypothetical protein
MAVCNKDCFNCPYEDCINDDLSLKEYKEDAIGEEVPHSVKMARIRANRYANSHKEKISEYQKKWYEKNKAHDNARSKQWSKDNKNRVSAAKRERWQQNPEYYREKQREYKARRKAEREGSEPVGLG